MKNLFFLLLLLPLYSTSQEYVDIIKMGYSNTFDAEFKGTNSSTDVKTFEIELTFPLVINEKNAIITGVNFNTHKLQLFPNVAYTKLYSTLLKLGLATTYSEKWSSTIVFLPKIASDYKNISGDDFYYGGLVLLKLQKKENLKYRFGFYASSEAFGLFATPIIGGYYLSPNKNFEVDASLPISVDINYSFGTTALGFDYFGIGRSFNISQVNLPNVYVEQRPLEFSTYVQFNVLQKSVLLRAKVGYTSNEYDVYADGDDLDFRLSAFSFGDDRTQLNPELNGGVFLKFEAIYRIHFKKDDTEHID